VKPGFKKYFFIVIYEKLSKFSPMVAQMVEFCCSSELGIS